MLFGALGRFALHLFSAVGGYLLHRIRYAYVGSENLHAVSGFLNSRFSIIGEIANLKLCVLFRRRDIVG